MQFVTKHYFNQNLTTRHIRVNPLTWGLEPSLRFELYGCSGMSAFE